MDTKEKHVSRHKSLLVHIGAFIVAIIVFLIINGLLGGFLGILVGIIAALLVGNSLVKWSGIPQKQYHLFKKKE